MYGLSHGPDIFADAFGAMEELTPMSLVSMLKGVNPGEQVYADISYTTILDYSKTFLAEHVLYGSSRLGTKNHWQSQYAFEYNNQASAAQNQAFLDGSAFNFRRPWYSYQYNGLISRFYTEPWDNPNVAPTYGQRVIGQKRYELNDHLGNVNAVVTDKLTVAKENTADPLPANAVQHAALHAAYDYYPFGMLMPERYIEDNTAQCTPVTRSQMTRRTIPCIDILFDDPNDELLVQPIGNADVVVTQAVGEIDGSIAVTAAEEEGTVGISVMIPNPCATVTEGVLISLPIENHLDGDLVVQVLQHDPGTNSSAVVASTTVSTAEDVNLTGIAVGSGDFTLEVLSEAGADFVVGALHYMTTEQLSENFVIVECNTDNIYGNDYRFGFNGQQKDNELKGLGNALDFKFRAYDSRLGKFLSRDPLAKQYPWNSTYAFAENTPIQASDLEGLEADFSAGKVNRVDYNKDVSWWMQGDVFGANVAASAWNQTVSAAEAVANLFVPGGMAENGKNIVNAAVGHEQFVKAPPPQQFTMLKEHLSNPENLENIAASAATSFVLGEMFALPKLTIGFRSANSSGSPSLFRSSGGVAQPSGVKYLYRNQGKAEHISFRNAGNRFTPNPSGNSLYLWNDSKGLASWKKSGFANEGPDVKIGFKQDDFNKLGLESSFEDAFEGSPKYYVVPMNKLDDLNKSIKTTDILQE